jgi:hypothetical protein
MSTGYALAYRFRITPWERVLRARRGEVPQAHGVAHVGAVGTGRLELFAGSPASRPARSSAGGTGSPTRMPRGSGSDDRATCQAPASSATGSASASGSPTSWTARTFGATPL